MRDELDKYELIDKYLSNQLSEKDLTDFTERMNNDPSLAEDVNSQRFVNEMAFDQGLLELKLKLKSLDTSSGTNLTKRWIIYSSSLLLLTATITSYVLKTNHTNTIKQAEFPQKTEMPEPIRTDENLKQKKPHTVNGLTPQKDHSGKTATIQQPIAETSHDDEVVVDPAITDKPPTEENYKLKESTEHQIENRVVPCTFEAASISVTTEQSCTDSPTGKITIDKNSASGKLSYAFSLNRGSYSRELVFYNLYAGTYHISVKDANGCIWDDPRDYVVEQKDCHTPEFSFIPERGEVWKFPIDNNTNGKIEIYNRDGRLVYKSVIVNGEPDQWNGTSDDEPLPMGSYSFILQNGKTITTGSVTIFR
jgi:hypothetical protein